MRYLTTLIQSLRYPQLFSLLYCTVLYCTHCTHVRNVIRAMLERQDVHHVQEHGQQHQEQIKTEPAGVPTAEAKALEAAAAAAAAAAEDDEDFEKAKQEVQF